MAKVKCPVCGLMVGTVTYASGKKVVEPHFTEGDIVEQCKGGFALVSPAKKKG